MGKARKVTSIRDENTHEIMSGNPKGRDRKVTGGRIILKRVLKIRREAVDYFYLAQNTSQLWRVLLNALINFRVLHKAKNVFINREIVSFSARTAP
jgi:hypothetical protein